VAWWAISQLPLPDPIRWIVIVVFALIVILALVQFLPLDAGLWRRVP
jgi:hypothetical protein